MKRSALIGLLAVTAGLSFVAYLVLTGPRMYVQTHVREFQAVMPPPPKGSVPLVDWPPPLPSAEMAARMSSPARATPENIARGRVYYGYYCAFCHGDQGDGQGPVGESYMPVPADLRTEKVRAYSDGQLLRTMLLGVGHEPVLERVVKAEHRWYLVAYVRTLASPEAAAAPPAPQTASSTAK